MPPLPTPLISPDKLIHALVYGELATVIYRCGLYQRGWKGALFAIILTSLYGASDEFHQSFTGRSCELNDWFADTFGAGLAVLSYYYLPFYRNILEYKFKFCAKKLKSK